MHNLLYSIIRKGKEELIMKEKEKRYIAVYARKSRFTHSGESITIQIEKCKNYARSLPEYDDATEIREYIDEGYSGGNTNRPDFQRLLDDCMKNRISIIICYRIDRISRNLSDFSQLYEKLKNHNTSFISVNEQFDTTTPIGEAMVKICMIFAELERKTIAERIRDNMLGLAKTGRWLGGTTPLGYRSEKLKQQVAVDNKVRYLYKLEPVPAEQEIYLTLVKQYYKTGSLQGVETYSHQTGLKTRKGKYFSTSAVSAILRNPVYAAADQDTYQYFLVRNAKIGMEKYKFDGKHGLMDYNKTKQVDGKANEDKPVEEWIIAVGKHKPFISGKEWIALQEKVEKGQLRAYRRPRNNTALLSGLLRCANCHSYMRPKNYNRVDANGNKVYAYLCEEKEKSKGYNCDMKNPRGMELDQLVCDEIKKLAEDGTAFQSQLNKVEQLILKESNQTDSEISLLNMSLKEKENRIGNLLKNLSETDEIVTRQYINDEIKNIHYQKQDIEQKIHELKLAEQDKLKVLGSLSILQERLADFPKVFDMMSFDEKKAVLRSLIKTIFWDGNTVHIYLVGCSDDMIMNIDAEDFIEPIEGGSK